MVNFIKKKSIIILIVTTLLLSFYWFQYRPSEISKKCARKSKEAAITLAGKISQNNLDQIYIDCIHAEGIIR